MLDCDMIQMIMCDRVSYRPLFSYKELYISYTNQQMIEDNKDFLTESKLIVSQAP